MSSPVASNSVNSLSAISASVSCRPTISTAAVKFSRSMEFVGWKRAARACFAGASSSSGQMHHVQTATTLRRTAPADCPDPMARLKEPKLSKNRPFTLGRYVLTYIVWEARTREAVCDTVQYCK